MKVALPEEVGKPGAQQDYSLGTEAQFILIINYPVYILHKGGHWYWELSGRYATEVVLNSYI
jgi:hypothetical protein